MAYSAYSSDNTFFVESDEATQRMTMRDAAKMLARNKQEMIANELSRLACDEYLEDIMQHMRHMEVREVAARPSGFSLFWGGGDGLLKIGSVWLTFRVCSLL